MNYHELINKIKEYDLITIFRHVNPDSDAFGAQLGLKYWIELNFPDKTVFALGDDNPTDEFFDMMDIVTNDIVKNSLAIVVDTATSERTDGNFQIAPYIIKIDHHIDTDSFGNLNIVKTNSAATCQLLAEIFLKFPEYKIDKKISETLYRGLLTDTLGFKTSNTTSKTLLIASKLSEYNLDIPKLNRDMFDKHLSEFIFNTKLRTKLKLSQNQKFGYAIVNENEVSKSNLTAHQIRSNVSQFNTIKELEIWAVFTEKKENNIIEYDGSLRSKTISINEIAQRFNGGGHKNACGVKDLTKKQLDELIQELSLLSNN